MRWWINQILTNETVRFGAPALPTLTITTDASKEGGWGATFSSEGTIANFTHGCWSRQDQQSSINKLELLALHHALLHIKYKEAQWKDRSVLVRSDNTTVVYNVQRKRSSYSLRKVVRGIFSLVRELNISLCAQHIPGSSNTLADSLSRISRSGDYSI